MFKCSKLSDETQPLTDLLHLIAIPAIHSLFYLNYNVIVNREVCMGETDRVSDTLLALKELSY